LFDLFWIQSLIIWSSIEISIVMILLIVGGLIDSSVIESGPFTIDDL